ncbi:transglycosylase domain-containing protein [Dermatobacter hominis]|uniref:transglycosylase domain-containing protein n=1 Tax=Dermatobacter hominis TaxID=2884263 RepID=UPI001D11FFDD|nr:transglycosylase domain-containing protein [Dermatobacter hominis]UDY36235.1 transglycosylase domain-containing protein [Dermatobacter hominis]
MSRSIRLLAALAGLCVLASVTVACGGATRDAPPLLLPVNAAPTTVFDAKGRVITVLRDENRTSVPLEQIPNITQTAVVAIEDSRFWSHKGVDPRAIARAASSNAEDGEAGQGGSTITQQYVKTALLSPEKTLQRKLEEASMALSIERNYSKSLILELYLNTIYFGDGAYGIDAAARSYFGVPAGDLDLARSALLAGLIQAPSRYDPRKHPEAAVARRNVVLARMLELGDITPAQHDAAAATPVELAPPQPLPEQVPYPAAHFVDAVKEYLLKDSDVLGDTQGERYNNLYRGGLRIHTTIDLDLQAQAEQSIAQVLPGQGTDPKVPDASLVTIDPRTGAIRAMVGGRDYFGTSDYRQTNLARGVGRQTGSAFKPIVLAAALANGVPTTKRFDAPSSQVHQLSDGTTWRVKGGGIGSGTMAECTVVSSNTCYANIVLDPAVGGQRSVDMAKALGVVSTKLLAIPSAVLGTNNATVQDMASVYATFANQGVYVPPVMVTRIDRPDGTMLYQHEHTQTKVLEPEVAIEVSNILPGVISGGTGTRADIGRPAGGKTGSSQSNVDGWFCGYTPQLATAVWVGFAKPRPGKDGKLQPVPMTPPNTRITVYGGTYPAMIWSSFMKKALADQPPLPLVDPLAAPPATTTVPSSNAALLSPVTVPGDVKVPDLGGKDTRKAIAAVRSAGLEPVRIDAAVSGVGPGTVTGQSPAPGASAAAGSKVYVESTPGTFLPATPVPNVIGFGTGQAEQQLESLGYTVRTEAVAAPPGSLRTDGQPFEAGQVWRSIPAAGERPADGVVVLSYQVASAAPPTTPAAPTTAPRRPTAND